MIIEIKLKWISSANNKIVSLYIRHFSSVIDFSSEKYIVSSSSLPINKIVVWFASRLRSDLFGKGELILPSKSNTGRQPRSQGI